MENLSRNEVIAIFALGVSILGVFVGALTLQKAAHRIVSIFLLIALSVAFYAYLEKSLRTGIASRELSKEEMIKEAQRYLLDEQARQEEAFKIARERIERERGERENAERAAKEAANRDKAEQDAREAIAQEDAVKRLRERIGAEKEEQARKAAEEGIVGRWEIDSYWHSDLEFTKDGHFIQKQILATTTYRIVDSTHVELSNWARKDVSEFHLSGDTLVFNGVIYKRSK